MDSNIQTRDTSHLVRLGVFSCSALSLVLTERNTNDEKRKQGKRTTQKKRKFILNRLHEKNVVQK